MTEQWKRWEPIQGLDEKYRIVNITDSLEEFTIELVSTNNKQNRVLVVFEISVRAYKFADESFKQNLINHLGTEYEKKFFTEWTFFKVDNSAYMQWLFEESLGWSDAFSFMHLSLVGYDSIIDIASDYEPTITFI